MHAGNYGVYEARKVFCGVTVPRYTIERLTRDEGLRGGVRGRVMRTTGAGPEGRASSKGSELFGVGHAAP